MPAGEAVIREGDAPDALYVLVDGAAVVTSGAGGRLNAMAAGDFFGEIGLLKGVPRTATVTTTEPCTLLRIEGDVFLSLVRTGVAQRGVLGRSVGDPALGAARPGWRRARRRRRDRRRSAVPEAEPAGPARDRELGLLAGGLGRTVA